MSLLPYLPTTFHVASSSEMSRHIAAAIGARRSGA